MNLADDSGEEHAYVHTVKAHLKLHRDQHQYTRLCVVGNGYADKGAKWVRKKHPGS